MLPCRRDITERIRIIRRLDFTQGRRNDRPATSTGQILGAVVRRRTVEDNRLLRSHIEASKAEVRKITVHRLYAARGAGP